MIPHPQRVELEGGARIVYAPNPASPFVSFQGSLAAGVAAERPGEEGVANFLSRLLLSGTRVHTSRQLAEALEGLGATLEFGVSMDAAQFYGRCTRRTAGKVFPIVGECLTSSVLPAREVERVRAEILTEIEEDRDDTRARAQHELLPCLYRPGHPYGRDPKGEPDQVKAIEPGVLLEFRDRLYGQEGLILAAAGDVDDGLIRNVVAKTMATLSTNTMRSAAPGDSDPQRPSTRTVSLPHKSQTDIAIGLQAISRSHPDFYALNLANLLFGVIGMYGRLGATVREDKGLAYYSLSRLRAMRHGGHWTIIAGVNPDRLESAMAAISQELDRLIAEPFTDDEIENGKLNQIGGLAVHLDRNAEVASALHEIEFHDLGLDYLDRFPGIVGDLTREEVVKAAGTHIRKRDCSVAVAGPLRGEVRTL